MFPMPHAHPMLDPVHAQVPSKGRRSPLRRAASLVEALARVAGRAFVILFLTTAVARFALVPVESRVARLALGPRPELNAQRLTGGRTPFAPSLDDGIVLLQLRGASATQLESAVGSVPMIVVFERSDVAWYVGDEQVRTDLGGLGLSVSREDLLRHGAHLGDRIVVRVEVTYRVSWQSSFDTAGDLDPVVRSAEHAILVE
jgi:hypothetical protein